MKTFGYLTLCGNEAGNLTNGELVDAANKAYNGQAHLQRRKDGSPVGMYTDINGDGKDEAVISYY